MRPLHRAQFSPLIAAGMAREGERLALWLPVAFGSGALCYFILAEEPSALWPAVLAGGAVVLWWLTRSQAWLPLSAAALLLFAAGWGWSQLSSGLTAAPMLERELWGVTVSGRVVDIDPQEVATMRVVLDRPRVEGLAAEATPDRVRLTYRASDRPVQPGDRLEARAVLRPPSPPVAPGGHDFQRDAWFARIGAVGFALGAVTTTEDEGSTDGGVLNVAVEQLRRAIADEIAAALDGPTAALATALVVGERGTMGDDDVDAMRAAGLSHLIAISGLHIGIVAGFVFWTTRAGMALVPTLAVRYPIKKWAAVAGVLAALAYTLIAGLTPPTLRAFLMVAVALAAMMIDRNPISMRLVGVAALLVIVATPSTILGPSFQLSFAAVVALIAGFESLRARRTLMRRAGVPRNRALLYLGGVMYSSALATIATTPYSLFHFQQVALFGIVANLAAIPLMAFWVVPLLAIGCIASLVGLGQLAFVPAGWGIDLIRLVAHTVADWPGAILRTAVAEGWTLGLATIGGLWICLWHSRLRWAGLAPLAIALTAMIGARPPHVLVAGWGEPFAVLSGDGRQLLVPSLRRDRFTTESWARLSGLGPSALAAIDEADVPGLRCDAFGCVTTVEGRRIAITQSFDAFLDDCARADMVVLLYPGSENCPDGTPTVRYLDLVIDGAHVVTVGADGEIEVDSVATHRGRRPWAVTSR